jgi:hypothetical protein
MQPTVGATKVFCQGKSKHFSSNLRAMAKPCVPTIACLWPHAGQRTRATHTSISGQEIWAHFSPGQFPPASSVVLWDTAQPQDLGKQRHICHVILSSPERGPALYHQHPGQSQNIPCAGLAPQAHQFWSQSRVGNGWSQSEIDVNKEELWALDAEDVLASPTSEPLILKIGLKTLAVAMV